MRCQSQEALLRGFKPQSSQRIQCGVCPYRCIYCDIWKLATLIFTRLPLSQRFPRSTSPQRLHRSSRSNSPTHQETFDWEPTERMIEAQFQTQRARLASIMSICTFDGAEESEGLRVAHDRCAASVSRLLYQEKVLGDTIIRSVRDGSSRSSSRRPSTQRMTSHECGTSFYRDERRPSRVGLAM